MIDALIAIAFLSCIFLGLFFCAKYVYTQIKFQMKASDDLEAIEFPKYALLTTVVAVIMYNLTIHNYIFDYISNYYGLGMSMAIMVFFASSIFLFKKESRNFVVYFIAGTGVVAGATLSVTASDFLSNLNLNIAFFSALALIFVHAFEKIDFNAKWLFVSAYKYITNIFSQMHAVALYTFGKSEEKTSRAAKVLKTSAISIAVFVVFATLLANADPVFSKFIDKFLTEFIDRSFISAVIILFAVFAMSYKLKPVKENDLEFGFLSYYDIVFSVAGLVFLFGAFLGIQAEYLFASNADFASLNLSYSEYTRKGVQELITATIFGTIISLIVNIKQKYLSTSTQQNSFKILNTVLIFELIAVLGSALKRNLLYIETYDLTRLRIAGLFFFAWLSVFLVLLIVVNWQKVKNNVTVSKVFAGASLLFLIVFNFSNIDAMIAKNPPKEQSGTDYIYIAYLSPANADAWGNTIKELKVELKDLIENKDQVLSQNKISNFIKKLNSAGIIRHRIDLMNLLESKHAKYLTMNYEHAKGMNYIKNNQKLFTDDLACVVGTSLLYLRYDLPDKNLIDEWSEEYLTRMDYFIRKSGELIDHNFYAQNLPAEYANFGILMDPSPAKLKACE